jgi:hypothetical protein
MNTIKNRTIILLLFILLTTCIIGSSSYINSKGAQENYSQFTQRSSNANFETVSYEKGLSLNAIDTMQIKNNVYYNEIDKKAISIIIGVLTNVVFLGDIVSDTPIISITDDEILERVSETILTSLNKSIQEYDKFTFKIPFTNVIHEIISKQSTSTNEYIIQTRHVVHRESKMYGFVIVAKSIWKSDTMEMRGFVDIEPTGIVFEDMIEMYKGKDINQPMAYRSYGDTSSYIQEEVIMKTQDFEEDVVNKQVYGLLKDRGISSKSFTQ